VTCRLGSENSGGEVSNSSSNGNNCFGEQDAFMKFQPVYFSFNLNSQISVQVPKINPPYISESKFGIVDSKATIVKITTEGTQMI